MAVHQLGRSGLVVAGQQRDRLDQHAVSRHRRHERMRNSRGTTRCLIPQPWLSRGTAAAHRDHPAVSPQSTRTPAHHPATAAPAASLSSACRARCSRSASRTDAAAPASAVTSASSYHPSPVGPPDEHRRLLVIEPGLASRLPLPPPGPQHDPAVQRPDFLGPPASLTVNS
jgi:hypothetical protein